MLKLVFLWRGEGPPGMIDAIELCSKVPEIHAEKVVYMSLGSARSAFSMLLKGPTVGTLLVGRIAKQVLKGSGMLAYMKEILGG